jgi:hypothetical protein
MTSFMDQMDRGGGGSSGYKTRGNQPIQDGDFTIMEEIGTKEGEMSTNMQVDSERNVPTQESQVVAEEEEGVMQVDNETINEQA